MKIEPNKKYNTIAAYTIGVVFICLLLLVLVFKFGAVLSVVGKILSAISSVLIGVVIAYILNPIVVFLENKVLCKIFKKDKPNKVFRAISVVVTMLLFLAFIATVVGFVIPEIIESVSSLVLALPTYAQSITLWTQNTLANNEALRDFLIAETDTIVSYIQDIAGKAGPFISSLANGVIEVVYGVFRFLIGCIVATYLLLSKEKFIAQIKKIIVSLTPRQFSYKFFSISHKIDQILIGSVLGKILDSLIIGIICFIGMMIFNKTIDMPYPILISVIVGVTNIIPFFGPFIGAIPSAFLVFIEEISNMNGFEIPFKTIWFIVFILVLQQFDGNFLGPKLQGEMVGLSAFWILFSILLGGGLFGFFGMLLAVPVFAIVYMLTDLYVNYKLRKRGMVTETDAYYGKFDLIKDKIYGTKKVKETEETVKTEEKE